MHRLLLAAVLCGACEGVRLNVREPADASACAGVSSRVDCGYENITPDFCTARGCCYAAEAGQPSCYYPSDGVAIKRVHLIQSNHFDAGYTDTATNVVNEYFTQYFPLAAALGFELESQAVNASSPRLRWLTQAYLVSLYLNCPPNQGLQCPNSTEIATFKDAVGKGWITWHAFPHNAEIAEMAPNMVEHALRLVKDVDHLLGVSSKTVLSVRDVPGFPRSVIPLLADHGVTAMSMGGNGRVNPPNVPPAFIWQDGASGAGSAKPAAGFSPAAVKNPSQKRLLTFWHGYGYGRVDNTGQFKVELDSVGPNRPIDSPTQPEAPTCRLPGFDESMVYAWKVDNSGPPETPEAVAAIYAQAAAWFPGAEIVASTLDDFAAAFQAADEQSGGSLSAQLPVVTKDLADTWVMGSASDPWKTAHARAVGRAYAKNCTESCLQDPRVKNATRQFIKNGEHTWGSSIQKMGPEQGQHWDNPAFHQQLAANQSNLRFMESTWVEQRDFGFTYPMQALSGHPLQQAIEREFAELSPGSAPNLTNAVRIPTASRQVFSWCSAVPGVYGSLADVVASGKTYNGSFGTFVYQTLNDDVFAAWRVDYLLNGSGGDNEYGKPNVTAAVSPNATYKTEPTWYLNREDSLLIAEMQMDPSLHTKFGAPRVVYVTYDLRVANSIGITLQIVGKTPTRIPEAMYFHFQPAVAGASDITWQMDKLGTWTNPLDVIDGASKGLHAVASGVLAQMPAGNASVFFESRDSSLVRWGPGLYPFCAPMVGDIDVTQGVAYVLHDNSWNTDFPLWYPFDDSAHHDSGGDLKWQFYMRF